MDETTYFQEYPFNNIPPSLTEMDMLMEDLLKYLNCTAGWELFKEMFELIISKGQYYLNNNFPDPLSFNYFREEYGDRPGMEDMVRRLFSLWYPIGENEFGENKSLDSAHDMVLYFCFTYPDSYAWDHFKELFKTLTEEEQKGIIADFSEYFKDLDTEELMAFLLA